MAGSLWPSEDITGVEKLVELFLRHASRHNDSVTPPLEGPRLSQVQKGHGGSRRTFRSRSTPLTYTSLQPQRYSGNMRLRPM